MLAEKRFGKHISIARFLPFLAEHIAQSEPIVYFSLFAVVANRECLFVERDGRLVFLQLKMALGIRKIIYRAFVRSKYGKARGYLVKIIGCIFIFPFVVIAQTNIGTKAVVQFVSLVQLLENKQCFVIFPRIEISHSLVQLHRVGVGSLRRCRQNRQAQKCQKAIQVLPKRC